MLSNIGEVLRAEPREGGSLCTTRAKATARIISLAHVHRAYRCSLGRPPIVFLVCFDASKHAQAHHREPPVEDYLEEPTVAVERQVEPHKQWKTDEPQDEVRSGFFVAAASVI